jgi:hypothetical protein
MSFSTIGKPSDHAAPSRCCAMTADRTASQKFSGVESKGLLRSGASIESPLKFLVKYLLKPWRQALGAELVQVALVVIERTSFQRHIATI